MKKSNSFNLREYMELSKTSNLSLYAKWGFSILFIMAMILAGATRHPICISGFAMIFFFLGGLVLIIYGFLSDKLSRFMIMTKQLRKMSDAERKKVCGPDFKYPYGARIRGGGMLFGWMSGLFGSGLYRAVLYLVGLGLMFGGVVFLTYYFFFYL